MLVLELCCCRNKFHLSVTGILGLLSLSLTLTLHNLILPNLTKRRSLKVMSISAYHAKLNASKLTREDSSKSINKPFCHLGFDFVNAVLLEKVPWYVLGVFSSYCIIFSFLCFQDNVCIASCALSHLGRFSHSMTTCVSESRARTTWSASRCCASTAPPPSFPRPPSCSVPSTPSQAFAAAAQLASRAITARQRSTCATPTPVWMVACAPAEREGSPVSAVKTTQVSRDGSVTCDLLYMWSLFYRVKSYQHGHLKKTHLYRASAASVNKGC